MKNIMNQIKKSFVTASLFLPASAFASSTGSGLPWESTLDKISSSISGPVLLAIATVMLVIILAMAAFGEWSEGFQKILKVGIFLSAAFEVGAVINVLFGGGAVM